MHQDGWMPFALFAKGVASPVEGTRTHCDMARSIHPRPIGQIDLPATQV